MDKRFVNIELKSKDNSSKELKSVGQQGVDDILNITEADIENFLKGEVENKKDIYSIPPSPKVKSKIQVVEKESRYKSKKRTKRENRNKISLLKDRKKKEKLNSKLHSSSKDIKFDYLTCVIVKQFPNYYPLTDNELNILNDFLKSEMELLKVDEFAPKFEKSYIKNGLIIYKAVNMKSKNWLKTTVPKLYLIRLKVTTRKQLYKVYKSVKMYIPFEKVPNRALIRIQERNIDVDMSGWQIVSCEKNKSGLLVQLKIPEFSVKALKKRNYKLFNGIEELRVEVLNNIKD